MRAEASPVPLSPGQKVAYGIGDFGLNLFWNLTSFFLLYFYTDVYGISAMQAGTIYFIARLWDALSDPLMGYLADRSRSRWGKFRPYLLFGAAPLALSAVAAFSTPGFTGSGKFYWALCTYITLSTLYTLVSLPYSSLLASISQDTRERSIIAGTRMVFATFGGLLVGVAAKPLIGLFASEQQGFQWVVSGYALLAVAVLWYCFANTEERYSVATGSDFTLANIYAMVSGNKPLLLLSAAVLASATAESAKKAAAIYFLKYNLGREDLFAAFALVGVLSVLSGVLLSLVLRQRLSKRDIYLLGTATYVVSDIAMWFVGYQQLAAIFVLSAMGGMGFGICVALMWSMSADTVEYGQWVSGLRAEGVVNAFFSFVQKVASAVGALVVGVVLQSTHYSANQVQGEAAVLGIFFIMFVVPVGAGILAIMLIARYPLDQTLFDKLLADIKHRAAGGPGPDTRLSS